MNAYSIQPACMAKNKRCTVFPISVNLKKISNKLTFLILVFLWAAGLQKVAAQTWEKVYGAADRIERGYGMTPIYRPCGTTIYQPAYVTVGMTDPTVTGNTDLYVVKTGTAGNRIWEYTYDIGNNNRNDIAYGVVEDENGDLIIVGSTERDDTSLDMFLLRVDCDGTMNILRMFFASPYPYNTGDDVAYDIILLPPTLGGTNDYGIAGYTTNTINGTKEAVLMRIDYTGGIIWGRTYRVNNEASDEVFYTVCSVANSTDLVGAGYVDNGTERDGYIVRVGGANGTMVGALQGSGRYGAANQLDDEIHSVTEMLNPAENGGIAMTGLTQGNQILLARVNNANFTFGLLNGVEYSIAVPGAIPYGIGYDIKEAGPVPPAPGIPGNVQPYDLAITGKATYGSSVDYDAFLYSYRNPFNAGPPLSVIAQHYGGPHDDEGQRVFIGSQFGIPAYGFAVVGSSMQTSDPQDMYMIKTNLFGNTDCSNPTIEIAQYALLHSSIMSTVGQFGLHSAIDPVQLEDSLETIICEIGTKQATDENAQILSSTNLSEFPVLVSNFIHRGDNIDIISKTNDNFNIVVYNLKGVEVIKDRIRGGGTLNISTTNWPGGTYFVQVVSEKDKKTNQAIIIR